MSLQEVRVRLGQELSKRYDLTAYRLGFPALGPVLNSNAGITGTFFFSGADVPGRVQCLRTFLPEEASSIVSEADEICCHHFHLLGYRNLDYGSVIDWHLDAVSGKRRPLEPWFKIPFLDYAAVGDHKVIWELNRHQHLVTLAKAWRLTGDRKYLDEIAGQWDPWQQANPYPLGINWASSLEVAFRSLSWLWMLALVADCPQFTPTLRGQVVSALAFNARYIERYLSTYFSPNTHLLAEATALFFIGAMCPQLPEADRWKNKGWQILLREAERQVRGDGVYFEQSLYYHVYALDFFLHARILAARNGVDIPKAFDEKIKRMLDVLQSLGQAGPVEGFGDDDGGRVFNPRRNCTQHLTDPSALGALLYGRDPSASVTEEAIWLFGEQAVSSQREQRTRIKLHSRAFSDGGLYVMADAETNMQLVIDAGPQGTGRSGHGHADALSIVLTGAGRRWLVDSGTLRYISNSDERGRFRGTAAHNTLRVDGMDQAVAEGAFAWSAIPRVTAERWVAGDSFDFFAGSHDGYMRLPNPVTHRRFVFLLKGAFWLVRDIAVGTGLHDVEISWHFASDLTLRNENHAFIAEPAEADGKSVASVVMQTCEDSAWAGSIETAPISPAYGRACSAAAARLHTLVAPPADCAVLLIPQSRSPELGDFSSVIGSSASGVRAYRYQMRRRDHYFFFAESDRPWDCGAWNSDAQFLYCGFDDGRLVHLIFVAGEFCRWNDSEVVILDHRVDRFEWLRRDHTVTTRSSDDAAIRICLDPDIVCPDPVV